MAVAVFIMPIAVQWWAVWYPGAEPGGGSYIAQRMLASKSEKDSLGAVLFFNVAHYVLRPWPWILVGARARSSSTRSSRTSRRRSRTSTRALLGHDIAYPGDAQVPAGRLHRPDGRRPDRGELLDHPDAPQLGRVVPGARLLPRFIRKDATEKHYVLAGRLVTVGLFFCSSGDGLSCSTRPRTPSTSSSRSAPGTGLLYLVRWFWWRVNAWCEVVAMVSSFARLARRCWSLAKNGVHFSTHVALLVTIAVTTVCWVATAFVGPADRPPDADRVLQEGAAVRARAGTRIREEAGARARTQRRRPATTSRSRSSAGWPAAR